MEKRSHWIAGLAILAIEDFMGGRHEQGRAIYWDHEFRVLPAEEQTGRTGWVEAAHCG
jgi:hypothetical protein